VEVVVGRSREIGRRVEGEDDRRDVKLAREGVLVVRVIDGSAL
jgi:hypothetical protein